MAATVLTDCTIHADGFDFTGHSNSISLSAEVDDQDATTFGGNGWRQKASGLKECEAQADVFWQSDSTGSSDAVDEEMFTHLGHSGFPITIGPTRTEGDPVYLFKASSYSYELLGDVGDLSTSTLEVAGSDTQGLIRGKWAKIKGNVTTTGALGSPVNLGAGGAGKFLYASFHVFSAGTTLSLKVQSDNTVSFTTPTDVTNATIGPLTARGGRYGFVASTRIDATSITDNWFRFNVTAVTGTFSVAGAIAIQ